MSRSWPRSLELTSIVEATTLLLLLLIAEPAKILFKMSWMVHLVGPLHGLAFVIFASAAVQTVATNPTCWSIKDRVRLFAGAFIPGGGFFNLRFISRKLDEPMARPLPDDGA